MRPVIKICLSFLWTLLFIFPVWLAKLLNKKEQRDRMAAFYCKGLLFIIGIKLIVNGSPSSLRPLLAVSNHLSYLDVPILASITGMRFTPKSEIAKWPVIGGIARTMEVVFVERRADKIKEAQANLRDSLARGNIVSLFAESTTGDGMHVLPFRSSFFSLAESGIDGKTLYVQPIALTFVRVRRLPVDMTQWPYLAWYGDMPLFSHVWNLLSLGPIEAAVTFLEPVTVEQYPGRKQLAAYCQRVISEGVLSMKAQAYKDSKTHFAPKVARWIKNKYNQ